MSCESPQLTIDKDTNPGWLIAILCVFQTGLVTYGFPREGSKLINKKEEAKLPVTSSDSEEMSWRKRWMHRLKIAYFLYAVLCAPTSKGQPHTHKTNRCPL